MFYAMRYHGPSLEELHDKYATRRRVDQAAPIQAVHQLYVDAPVEAVWALLHDPAGWPRVDSAIRDVRLNGPVQPDTRFTWRNGSTKLRSRFAIVDPYTELSWTGAATGARAVHRHVLTPTKESTTLLRGEESMAGALLGLFYNSHKLHADLVHWLTAFKTAAEAGRQAGQT